MNNYSNLSAYLYNSEFCFPYLKNDDVNEIIYEDPFSEMIIYFKFIQGRFFLLPLSYVNYRKYQVML